MSILIEYLKLHAKALIGSGILIVAFVNGWHATKQQDKAWDMPDETDTERICRQIGLLETRVWVLGWWVMAGFGMVLLFID